MSVKEYIMLILTVAFLQPILSQNAFGYDPNWKENQQKIFAEIDVKPGDVIDQSNYQKIEGLVPEGIVNWLKKGEWKLRIGEFKFDFGPDKQYIDDSAKNAGKYKIVSKGKVKWMVEAATGKVPVYVYGYPFPNVDVKNDPDGVIKMMYNAEAEMSRSGQQWNHSAAMDWIGEGGYERTNVLDWLKLSFWQRPDGEIPNPGGYKFMEMIPVSKPYDAKGVNTMFYRMADGSRDKLFCYIPALRRVKRMSGGGRSDPTLGSDTCMDDAGGWSGDNSSMTWKFLDEKICLFPVLEAYADHVQPFTQEPDGAWISDPGQPDTQMGWMDKTWEGAPWAMLNVVWVPRRTYVVEATPLDPYYNYGKTDIYLDKETQTAEIKTVYNKAMEYWKIVLVGLPAAQWGERRSFQSVVFTLGVDDRTHHASQVHSCGSHMGEKECQRHFAYPKVNRALFVPAKLKIWSK